MVDFLFYDLFPLLVGIYDRVVSIVTLSVRSLISDYIGISLPSWEWLDFSLLALMLGVGLSFFVIYTLIKWILDIVL